MVRAVIFPRILKPKCFLFVGGSTKMIVASFTEPVLFDLFQQKYHLYVVFGFTVLHCEILLLNIIPYQNSVDKNIGFAFDTRK